MVISVINLEAFPLNIMPTTELKYPSISVIFNNFGVMDSFENLPQKNAEIYNKFSYKISGETHWSPGKNL